MQPMSHVNSCQKTINGTQMCPFVKLAVSYKHLNIYTMYLVSYSLVMVTTLKHAPVICYSGPGKSDCMTNKAGTVPKARPITQSIVLIHKILFYH